eukprot:CAMPEP_0177588052 /NCGR_PEP_ID=MMETSP0419_2-20121207/6010_1 /TAXON_ID=582737 /ORGANISM="Tetraselmis sp., Strain GSL018" /LENGTH=81 /DNA_ID=CAMNT_0019078205 /DNA_START=160 /DNA_END=405 /DNA_ORIENTATION=+
MTSFRDRLERGKACALSPQMKLRVDQWLEFDSDEESRHVVQHLAQTENEGELNEILGSRLQFGKPNFHHSTPEKEKRTKVE